MHARLSMNSVVVAFRRTCRVFNSVIDRSNETDLESIPRATIVGNGRSPPFRVTLESCFFFFFFLFAIRTDGTYVLVDQAFKVHGKLNKRGLKCIDTLRAYVRTSCAVSFSNSNSTFRYQSLWSCDDTTDVVTIFICYLYFITESY